MNIRRTLQFLAGLALALVLWSLQTARGSTIIGPWQPIFKGIDQMAGTNLPTTGTFPDQFVVRALRVDLTDPDIRIFTTPRIVNYSAESRETGGLTVSDFLRTNKLQAAINANFFDPSQYYLAPGTAMDPHGLAISAGVVVSPQEDPNNSAAVIFDAANHASIIYTNWPPTNNAGIYNAVSGIYPLVVRGVNIGYNYNPNSDQVHQVNPRTVFGLSQDRRYLYLIAIDGRQSGYSNGALDYESAGWAILLGAYDAVNMDGGGSTTLVIEDATKSPRRLNHPNSVADSGKERTVGSHFGLYALPLPGSSNDVQVTSIFDVTNTWRFTTNNLDGIKWTATNYNDSSWSGPGPGLLWVDTRASGPNTLVTPRNTQMPSNSVPVSGSFYPYTTYYLRTHFNVARATPGTVLTFDAYVDDGAVFYLNGSEIYRLRMPDYPAVISNSTLAPTYGCSGDATCVDEFVIPSSSLTNLVAGDNVLAVEVHNYNTKSNDITFGTALKMTQPSLGSPKLDLSYSEGSVTLNWDRGGFTLQQSSLPSGPWSDVPGPITVPPYSTNVVDSAHYFRLIAH